MLEQGQRRKELEHHKKELGLGQVQEQGHRKKMQELEHRRKLELGWEQELGQHRKERELGWEQEPGPHRKEPGLG